MPHALRKEGAVVILATSGARCNQAPTIIGNRVGAWEQRTARWCISAPHTGVKLLVAVWRASRWCSGVPQDLLPKTPTNPLTIYAGILYDCP